MRMLIMAATAAEVGQTNDFLQKNKFVFGKSRVELLISGVGPVATTYALAKEIYDLDMRPELVIQAGIAGSFDPALIGQTVCVSAEAFADLGVRENNQFKSIFDLKLAGENNFPFSHGILQNPHSRLLADTGLPLVSGITVSEITTSREKMDFYQQKFGALVESMEGAAMHYVCLMEKIPFLQIRAISNSIGERDKTKWKMSESVISLNQTLMSLVNKLTETHVAEPGL